MAIEDYPTSKVQNSTEKQLRQMLKSFKAEELPLWKLGLFLAYNALALTSMNLYVRRFVISRRPKIKKPTPLQKIKEEYTFGNAMKKGSIYGLGMGGLYISGLLLIGHSLIPLSTFKKYCQIQEAESSFSVRYNPQFQEVMLFTRLRQFGISEYLIAQIEAELNEEKERLIRNEDLTKNTIKQIRWAEKAQAKVKARSVKTENQSQNQA